MPDIPIRPDVSPSAHPDALGNQAAILDLPNTPGATAYAAGRNALEATYRLLSQTADAEAAVQDAAPSVRRRQSLSESHAAFLGPLRYGVGGIERFTGREALLSEAYTKAMFGVTPIVDREMKNIQAQIGRLETRVKEALTYEGAAQSSRSGQATEIRQFVKSFEKESERWKFLAERVDAQDQQAIDAVLGSPPYLSGLTADQHADLRVIAAEKWCPQDYQQLKACEVLLERVREGTAGLLATMTRLKTNAEAHPGTVAGEKLAALARGGN